MTNFPNTSWISLHLICWRFWFLRFLFQQYILGFCTQVFWFELCGPVKSRAPCFFLPYMPRVLHPPMPDAPRVLRGLFFSWFRASRDLVPHVLLFDRCSRAPFTSRASDDLCLTYSFSSHLMFQSFHVYCLLYFWCLSYWFFFQPGIWLITAMWNIH